MKSFKNSKDQVWESPNIPRDTAAIALHLAEVHTLFIVSMGEVLQLNIERKQQKELSLHQFLRFQASE